MTRSSWPFVIAIAGLIGAACWYDASVASASAIPLAEPSGAAVHAE